MADIFALVDLTTVTAFVIGVGTTIIAIALAEKGVGIGKRNVRRA